MKTTKETVETKGPARSVRIDSRDVARKIRKDQPPTTKVHTPKNAYRRQKFDWRDAIDEWDEEEDFISSSSSGS
jgi:hypothetical protein